MWKFEQSQLQLKATGVLSEHMKCQPVLKQFHKDSKFVPKSMDTLKFPSPNNSLPIELCALVVTTEMGMQW